MLKTFTFKKILKKNLNFIIVKQLRIYYSLETNLKFKTKFLTFSQHLNFEKRNVLAGWQRSYKRDIGMILKFL